MIVFEDFCNKRAKSLSFRGTMAAVLEHAEWRFHPLIHSLGSEGIVLHVEADQKGQKWGLKYVIEKFPDIVQ